MRHVDRLRRARDPLVAKGFDATEATVICSEGPGSTTSCCRTPTGSVRLVGVDDLYGRL